MSPIGASANAIWHQFLTERNETIAQRNNDSQMSLAVTGKRLSVTSQLDASVSLSNRVLSLCVCTTRRTRRHHVPGRGAGLPPVMAYPVIANTPPASFITHRQTVSH